MFANNVEKIYDNCYINFGKFKGMHVSQASIDWIYWWLEKREHDEEFGPDIDWDHKINAERMYSFNKNYLTFIYVIYKFGFGRYEPKYNKYKQTVDRFWKFFDENSDLSKEMEEARSKGFFVRDELEYLLYLLYLDSKKT